jgi:DeoR family transcriptional regulator, deoxyribose operon repressor
MLNPRQARLWRLNEVLQNGSMLRLKDAAALVNVSDMTVRRDIASEGSGLACLGGYVISAETPGGAPRYALESEQVANIQVKLEVGRRAAAVVKPGDTLFLDCGTTIPYVAEALPPCELTVVCYSLNIASIVCRRANTQVLLLGGLYYPSSATFFSEEAVAQLERIAITSAFISAGGVDFSRGVSCSHFHEVPVKQAAMASARHKYLVVDSSKFGRLRPATFARVDAFDSVFTDDGLSPAERARLPPSKKEGTKHLRKR